MSLASSTEWQMTAGGDSGRRYRIQVAWPEEQEPTNALPVLYVLDAQDIFATAVEAVRLQSRRGDVTGVASALVVGIGHPGDRTEILDQRRRDFTPPVDGLGGANVFLDFIEKELKPALQARFNIDDHRQAIFGHSFGGLFVLYALFTRPGAFRRYVAASPSIWWHDHAILRFERPFASKRPTNAALLVTVGSLEGPSNAPNLDAARRERLRQADMVRNARELAGRLHATFVEFAGENHGSTIPAALGRAVPFALSTELQRQ